MRVGVAISTTGDEHRLDLLRYCVDGWNRALEPGDSLYVTVDGDEDAVARVAKTVHPWTGSVVRVGQPLDYREVRDGRIGVAANKNTGLEYLMDHAGADRLWLSDDDMWPLSPASLVAHYNTGLAHSMVCWGRHLQATAEGSVASWSWPRGSVLHVERAVVEEIGGMVEAFGHGGHEHVEWSRRIYQRGWTPVEYPSPRCYVEAERTAATRFWYGADMPLLPSEPLHTLRRRRDTITTVHRRAADIEKSNVIMDALDGSTRYVSFRAAENNRSSATMITL